MATREHLTEELSPNKVSSFHVIGEIFDKVYSEGTASAVKDNVQTTLVARKRAANPS